MTEIRTVVKINARSFGFFTDLPLHNCEVMQADVFDALRIEGYRIPASVDFNTMPVGASFTPERIPAPAPLPKIERWLVVWRDGSVSSPVSRAVAAGFPDGWAASVALLHLYTDEQGEPHVERVEP